MMKYLVTLGSLLFCFFCPLVTSAEDRVWRIGAVLPLTGRAASVGVAIKNGILLAHQSLDEKIRSRLDIVFEDFGSETAPAVACTQRLLREKRVDLIIVTMSNAANAIAPVTERNNTVLISLAYDRSVSEKKQSTFTFWPDVRDLAAVTVTEAVQRGYKRIALVSTLHEGNVAMRDALIEAAGGRVEFVLRREILPAEVDLRSHALTIAQAKNLDAVALLMHPSQLGHVARLLRSIGFKSPFFTIGNFEDSNVKAAAAGSIDGQWYSAASYTPEFLERYHRTFPTDSTYGAPFGYDTVMLLAEAVRRDMPVEHLSHFLRNAKLSNGALRSAVADGENGFRFPLEIKIVGQDGI